MYSGPESKTSESVGIVREVRTASANLTGRQVEASEEEPRYEVRPSDTHTHPPCWLGVGDC